MLGALLADTRTRPVPVTGAAYSSESATRYNLAESRYEGPTGITGVLQDLFVQEGLPSLSFWAAVPHYVSTPANPEGDHRVTAARRGGPHIEVPLGTLPEQSDEWGNVRSPR